MKTKLYKNESRGTADLGWLKANYSFSFADYFDPERQRFGALRVLNDDCVEAQKGFSMHRHENMEIVTIPLLGCLIHKDNVGNEDLLMDGEIQVMSAGTGIYHSEFNANADQELKLLQLWIYPNEKGVKPRYKTKLFDLNSKINNFVTIVAPKNKNIKDSLWLHQDCYIYLGEFENKKTINFNISNAENGVYLFLISGSIQVDSQTLYSRDAIEIEDTEKFEIFIIKNSKILIVEVPMLN